MLSLLTLLLVVAGCSRAPRRPSIVLIVLDTLRADHVGQQIGGTSITPHLDALARESTVFTHAFANAPWTVPSHASMFTGLLPLQHGCHQQHLRLPDDVPTVAALLDAAGYQTAAFYSNYWLADEVTGLLRGFAVKDQAPFEVDRNAGAGAWHGDQGGPATLGHVAEWLAKRDAHRPFFAFVNFLECHLPYDPEPAVRRRRLADLDPHRSITNEWAYAFNAGLYAPGGVDWTTLRRLYAGDVETTDDLLGRLLDELDAAGLAKDTVVIVTSDHGENLGDHGLVEHQFSVDETLLDVPLVIHAPGRLPPGERSDPVMLLDLFATILDLAGVKADAPPPRSRSLVADMIPGDRPLIAEYQPPARALLDELSRRNPRVDLTRFERGLYTVRIGDLRATVGSDSVVTLHDLSTDPGQLHDLAWQRQSDLGPLLQALQGAIPTASADARGPELSAEARERLRSLGYVR